MAEEYYLDQYIDWCHEGVVTPPRNQRRSNACWAIAAVGAAESNWNIQQKERKRLGGAPWKERDNVVFSPQELYDGVPAKLMSNLSTYYPQAFIGCASRNLGFRYICDFGVRLEMNYPFIGKLYPRKLKAPDNSPRIFIEDYWDIKINDKREILDPLKMGPICGAMELREGFSGFRGSGIFEGPVINTSRESHAFLIVGQGVQKGIPYYNIRNSYGLAWGNGGFGKIRKDLVTGISYPVNASIV